MTVQHTQRTRRQRLILVAALVVVASVVTALLSRSWWLPQADSAPVAAGHDSRDGACTHADQDHSGHDHGDRDHVGPDQGDQDHAGHDEATSLQLSKQARKNVGLQLVTIERRDFDRTITIPAMVTERPGRTRIKVSAPMTGIVTRIHPIGGEAVTPGQPLFDLRLTHEDLVSAQSEFLRTVEEIKVIKREVARLEKVTASGAIAGKSLLARQYEQQRAEAMLHAQQQALILHGLSGEQVADIAANRKLVQLVTVFAPEPAERPKDGAAQQLLQVAEIEVEQGQQVAAGEPLCVLTDHARLYIEGKAFEEDAQSLHQAANLGRPITALVQGNGKGPTAIPGLKILYVENEVGVDSRALRFYVQLPNELVRNEKTPGGHHFIGWRYKPGQRVELLVPVQRWKDCIVLPVDAVVKEGADCFVFRQNGNCFHRQPVHVKYRDQRWAVIDSDGTLSPGDVVAASGAYQIHLTMKKKAGGGVDPHAGHNH